MPHPLFGPEIRLMLRENDKPGMTMFCETLHPATVAEALTDEFTTEEVWNFLQNTAIQNQAHIFSYLPIEWEVKLAEGTGQQHMARLIEKMSHDDRVDLLRRLPKEVSEGLLRLVDEADRRDIAALQRYAENTAGAIMTTDYAWLPPNITAVDALDRLRLQAPNTETIYYIYVLDDQRRLLGVVSLRQLILAPRTALVREFMETDFVAVNVNDDREKVAQEIARYDLIAIPVRDADGRLVGIVTYDDVIDVVVEEATEDVHRLGAVSPLEEKYLDTNFAKLWRNRAFWLSCLFVAETLTIQAMAHYETAMEKLVLLTLFIPLCISIGGNSGSQAVTLITRALAVGDVKVGDWLRVLRHELLMGVVLGLTLGLIGFFCVSVQLVVTGEAGDSWKVGLVVAQAVAVICTWGTLVGSMLPLGFKRLGIDPGIASSPFVATFVDVTGIIIYFTIATVYLL